MADELEEKLAGTLSYALGWITGIIFLLTDKRPNVRFHAAQSIVIFGGLQIITVVLGRMLLVIFGAGGAASLSLAGLVLDAIELLQVALWIVLLVKTYQGEMIRVPVAAELADKLLTKASEI